MNSGTTAPARCEYLFSMGGTEDGALRRFETNGRRWRAEGLFVFGEPAGWCSSWHCVEDVLEAGVQLPPPPPLRSFWASRFLRHEVGFLEPVVLLRTHGPVPPVDWLERRLSDGILRD